MSDETERISPDDKAQGGDVDVSASPFLSKLSNFWFYHKWKVIIAFAALLLIAVSCLLERDVIVLLEIVDVGQFVDAVGVSKGKGFQGSIKRHGHHRGPMAHGSKYHRGVGSMSSATAPGKVKKGKKMPGHMGNQKATVQHLEIMKIDVKKNLLLIKGSVPGPKKSLIFIRSSMKSKQA